MEAAQRQNLDKWALKLSIKLLLESDLKYRVVFLSGFARRTRNAKNKHRGLQQNKTQAKRHAPYFGWSRSAARRNRRRGAHEETSYPFPRRVLSIFAVIFCGLAVMLVQRHGFY
jgi:hypothetical protein